jgi:hypothetical protein
MACSLGACKRIRWALTVFLFYRGWFNLVLSIYKYVSGDNKWERPFKVAGYRDREFEWDHGRIVDLLERQYAQRPEGPHCENTKIWFFCNAEAALGIYLYDKLLGTQKYRRIERWLDYARRNYMNVSSDGKLQSITRYYDPIANFKLNAGPVGGIDVAFRLLPQQRELATFLYDAAANALGWRNPNRPAPANSLPLILAREFGDDAAAARMSAAAERANEPRFFGTNTEKFGWFFNLNEPYPRGQQSAMMMVSEVGTSGAGRARSKLHIWTSLRLQRSRESSSPRWAFIKHGTTGMPASCTSAHTPPCPNVADVRRPGE